MKFMVKNWFALLCIFTCVLTFFFINMAFIESSSFRKTLGFLIITGMALMIGNLIRILIKIILKIAKKYKDL